MKSLVVIACMLVCLSGCSAAVGSGLSQRVGRISLGGRTELHFEAGKQEAPDLGFEGENGFRTRFLDSGARPAPGSSLGASGVWKF